MANTMCVSGTPGKSEARAREGNWTDFKSGIMGAGDDENAKRRRGMSACAKAQTCNLVGSS